MENNYKSLRTNTVIAKIFTFIPFVPLLIYIYFFIIPSSYRPYILDLHGTWNVSLQQQDPPAEISNGTATGSEVKLPGGYTFKDNKNTYCWLTRKFKLKGTMEGRDIFFLCGKTYAEVEVFINGSYISTINSFGESTHVDTNPFMHGFTIPGNFFRKGANSISLKMTRNLDDTAWIDYPGIIIGVNSYLKDYYENNIFMRNFISSGVIMMSLFIIIIMLMLIFADRHSEEQYKYVTTIFVVTAGMIFNIANFDPRIIYNISIFAGIKFLHISIVLIPLTTVEFIEYYFLKKITLIGKINRVLCILIILVFLLAPEVKILYTAYGIAAFYFFLVLFYLAYITIRDIVVVKEKPYGIIILAVILVGVASSVNDLLVDMTIIVSPYMFYIASPSMSLAAGIIIVVDFINISMKNKTLNTELRDLNITLEQKVRKRTEDLENANTELTVINENLKETRDALWGEMQLAKKIQTVLLPEDPSMPGYEITAFMEPASNVGGDYYDIIQSGKNNYFIIGDVSGHGVSAGLIMMMVQTAIHTILENEPAVQPSELLIKINRSIYKNIQLMNESSYMTITVLAEIKPGEFVFSGLHQDILIHRCKEHKIEQIQTDGAWLGIMDDITDSLYDTAFSLSNGDTMLLYTDGITEAWKRDSRRDMRNPETDMYGIEALAETFLKNSEKNSAEIIENIINSMASYTPDDDVTMVVIRRIS